MLGALSALFDTSGWPARWHCGQWTAELGWLHILADTAIFLAYAAIPVTIATFLRRRRDVSYPKLYWLFAAFIFSCGFGHLLEASIFWFPWYRLAGLVKLCTALVSWATVIALIQVLPEALALPGAARLNEQLRREIEERKRAEEEVRRLNGQLHDRVEELETLLDVVPVAIGIATDTSANQIRANQAFAQMLRLPRGSNASLSAPAGQAPSHFEVFHEGERLPPEQLPLQRTAREGVAIRAFETEIVHEDGQRLVVEAHTAPLFDGQEVRGAVGAFLDLTALREAEEERSQVERRLQETQKLQSLEVLAGGVAHDFNNLLTGILGNASLARAALPAEHELHESLEQIQQAGTRAADLCRQMLAYAGQGRFVVTAVDLSEIVRETTWLLQSSIDKNAALQFALAEDLPLVSADATQLRQVVMNLVLNASEALGGREGTVRLATALVRTEDDRARVSLTVADDGCGMTPEVLARIFDPFFTTKFTGRGLGLAAVRGIVRGHGGTLEVSSEPGLGTVFRMLLPTSQETPPAEVPILRRGVWRGFGTILLVDDQEMVRKAASRMLQALGFEVVTASGGRDGLARFEEHRDQIVLVLLDLTMPQLDGHQTFEALRERDPSVKILLMSGYNEREAAARLVGRGLAGFLQKPFRLDDLRDKLSALLGTGPVA